MSDSKSVVMEEEKSLFHKFCIISIPIVLLLIFSLFVFGSRLSPEDTRYQKGEYNDRAVDAIAAAKRIVQRCIKEKQADHPKECDQLVKIFEISQWSLDLAAQESMADSTFTIANITYWQYLATGLTVIFLIATVLASYAFLYEASQATRFAKDTLAETKRATSYELKPYLSLIFESAYFGEINGSDIYEHEMVVCFSLVNDGLTPASHINISFQSGMASGVFFKRAKDWSGHPIVFHSLKAPLSTTLTSASGKVTTNFGFAHQLWTTDSEEWANEIIEYGAGFDEGWGEPEFTFWKIIFNGLEIRYKDLECENTGRHKLLKGLISAEVTGAGATLSHWEFCPDSEHDYYAQLAEQKRSEKSARGFVGS